MDADRLTYTVPEVAELLGVSHQTVRSWIGAGVLRAVQPSGEGGAFLVLAESLYTTLRSSAPVAEVTP